MHGRGSAGQAIDPVCGMTVDIAVATSRNLRYSHDGVDYYFCGRGCRLDFEENPGRYLEPGYKPSM
jgi:YHS domain-containing protein